MAEEGEVRSDVWWREAVGLTLVPYIVQPTTVNSSNGQNTPVGISQLGVDIVRT